MSWNIAHKGISYFLNITFIAFHSVDEWQKKWHKTSDYPKNHLYINDSKRPGRSVDAGVTLNQGVNKT